MTKQYDIINIVDDKSFTYQLYADMNVPIDGTSIVNSEVEDGSNILLATFTILSVTTSEDALTFNFAGNSFIQLFGTGVNLFVYGDFAGIEFTPTNITTTGNYEMRLENGNINFYVSDVLITGSSGSIVSEELLSFDNVGTSFSNVIIM